MIFSIQNRFLVFLLLPVTVILAAIGVASFFYARDHLMDEWMASAQLRLEKAAHEIEMRLDEKRELIDLIADAGRVGDQGLTQSFLVQRLSRQKGVRFVEITSEYSGADQSDTASSAGQRNVMEARPHQIGKRASDRNHPTGAHGSADHEVSGEGGDASLRLNVAMEGPRTMLVLAKDFAGPDGRPVGAVEVTVAFDSLMKHILDIGDWKGSFACLVKADGTYLAHTGPAMKGTGRLGETGNMLENQVLSEMKSKHVGTLFGQGHPPEWVAGFYRVPTTDWYLVLFSRGDVVLAPIVHFRWNYVLAGVASLICIGFLIHWNTRPVARSVGEISEAAAKVENGDYDAMVPEDRVDEIGFLKRRFNQMVHGLKERDLIERTFGRYMGKETAQELMRRPEALRLGGEKHLVTILMGDLRGFTQMAEKLRSEDVIRVLNRHFARMIRVIEKYRGIIVDFFGDSVLVFFDGLDENVAQRAADAVKCAVEMQREVASVSNDNQKDGLPALEMGIGINTGEVIVGNIGSESRAKYGIVGSAVNETDRIQSYAEGGQVIIAEQTYELLAGRIVVGPRLEVRLKGLDASRNPYQVRSIDA